jgi:hypothetical protein
MIIGDFNATDPLATIVTQARILRAYILKQLHIACRMA